jgi:hypothetical protein
MPLGTVNLKIEVCWIVGTYLFPLAMFLLAFATQYFSDVSSDFWFEESEQATTKGFPTTAIITWVIALCSFSLPASTPKYCVLCGLAAVVNLLGFHPTAKLGTAMLPTFPPIEVKK